MQAWEIREGGDIDKLELGERQIPEPGPGEVVVKTGAVSLNYRDLGTVRRPAGEPLVPCSDGAGVIAKTGAGVDQLKEGDRVTSVFFQSWIEGEPSSWHRSRPLGGPIDGMLQEYVLLSADGVTPTPDSFTDEEAATLPCAALTAWRALVVEGGIKAGDTVLCEGTGGVSIFALQFAKMHGAEVIITSSSDEKLEKAKLLGADHTINYRETPEWGQEVVTLTGGRGVDHVVEVGGAETLNHALQAVRIGGNVVLIGVLSGFQKEVPIALIFTKNVHMIGISVGCRTSMEEMIRAMDHGGIKPVIDRTFGFAEARQAFHYIAGATHFGKICIGVP